MLFSSLWGHMSAIRSTQSVPGTHLIGGESQYASQFLSTRTTFGVQQFWAQNALASIWNDTQVSKGNPTEPQVFGEAENHLI